ncbi:hypothetical protein, partial [Victivallis vadensis]|uniref:hypothetical protein n=1 Tax=Victivallis vadensis TaxID=172901 RepID=UPI00266D4526
MREQRQPTRTVGISATTNSIGTTMNKTSCIFTVFVAALFLAAVEVPTATPGTVPDFTGKTDIWINGGTPARSDFNKEKVADSFSGV